MLPCIHREKISKMVWEDNWDNLSDEYRNIIANDHLHTNNITLDFIRDCESLTDYLFNNPEYDFNDSFFFGHKRRHFKRARR